METKQGKYTKGPWKVSNYRPYNIIARDPKESTYEKGDDAFRSLALVCSDSIETTKADALLIACAPELLEALKRVREAFYVKGDSKSLKLAFEGTKELVAKAEGRA